MADRKQMYQEYLTSEAWVKLKESMPGPHECLACNAVEGLHLHHIYYPENVWETKHCHCCWLCASCHSMFHTQVGISLEIPQETWDFLKKRTQTIILQSYKDIAEQLLALHICATSKTLETLVRTGELHLGGCAAEMRKAE